MVVFLFYLAIYVIVLTAINLVLNPNPIYSALSLVLALFMLGLIYVLLQQEFFAVVQLLVYAGAIVVLFLFIIMLLNLEPGRFSLKFSKKSLLAFLVVLGLGFHLIPAVAQKMPTLQAPKGVFELKQIGRWLFGEYLLAFEALALVLMVALIGVVVIAKKNPE